MALRNIKRLAVVAGGIGVLCAGVPASLYADAPQSGAGSKAVQPLNAAENALLRMVRGDYPGAAQQAANALHAAPGDGNLHILAGALLLSTGDARGARTAFTNALTCDPEDALARYGMGLARLAAGDRSGAGESFAQAEKLGGDPSYLLLARRYRQWLDGVQVDVADAGLPDSFAPAQHALAGMTAMRRNDAHTAVAELEQSQAALPGDAIIEPGGVLMTFETGRPLVAGAPLLPSWLGHEALAAPLPAQRGLSGSVEITPDDPPSDTAYVGYELDGQPQGVVNVRPFTLNFDTRQATNGWHTLAIIFYDSRALEISRTSRRLRTANTQSHTGAMSERVTRLRAGLWQALTLRPDRFACAYTLGVAQQRLGDTSDARQWFARACAARPESSEARHGLAATGGVGSGGEAMWGGLPDEKVIALTFDDGPKPGLTEPLLQLLTSLRVPATFFVIGKHVMEYPELTRQIEAAGMEIANHSYTHRNLTKLPAEEVAREVMQTQAAVEMATGRFPRYLRPPGGNWNGSVANTVREWGLTPCMWTVDVYGSEVIGAQQVADAVLAQVRPGSVVLMHNGKMSTLQALPTIIRELRARGYAFATVDALAQRLSASRQAARQAAALYSHTRHAE